MKHIRGDELDFVRWLILEHTEFGAALHHDGARARWTGKDTKGMERAQLTMDAAVSLMKAIQHGADGLGKAVVAWLPENSSNPQLATLYTHRKALLDLLTEARADGEFSAKVGTEPKTHSVTFESKGGSLIGAWPVTVLPLAGYFVFAQRMEPAVHMKEATIEHSKDKVLQPAPTK